MANQKTQTIAGQEITLETGTMYQMVRTMLRQGSDQVTVMIREYGVSGAEDVWTKELPYEEANELIFAFDKEGMTFCSTRVW